MPRDVIAISSLIYIKWLLNPGAARSVLAGLCAERRCDSAAVLLLHSTEPVVYSIAPVERGGPFSDGAVFPQQSAILPAFFVTCPSINASLLLLAAREAPAGGGICGCLRRDGCLLLSPSAVTRCSPAGGYSLCSQPLLSCLAAGGGAYTRRRRKEGGRRSVVTRGAAALGSPRAVAGLKTGVPLYLPAACAFITSAYLCCCH